MTSSGPTSVDPAADPLLDLAFAGLDHAIDSVEASGGPLIPFVLARTGDRLSLQRFVTGRLEEGVALVEQHLDAVAAATADPTGGQADGACGAWDGYLTVEDTRSDAVLARAVDRTGAEVLLAQRYEVRGLLRKKARRIGNPALVSDTRADDATAG